MRVKTIEKNLKDVKKIFKQVAAEYGDCLKDNRFYLARLDMLVCVIFIKNNSQTRGECIEDDDGYRIHIFLNEGDSKKFIAFIMARELAHLLMFNFTIRKTAGRAKDSSVNATAVSRLLPDGNVYGVMLEKLIADYLARFIVDKMDFEDNNGQFSKYVEDNKEGFKVVEMLSGNFGESILMNSFIDYYDKKTERIYNLFWTCIINFSFNEIIDRYDEVMGKRAFKYLCEKIEKYFSYKKDMKSKKIIKTELERFTRLCEENY